MAPIAPPAAARRPNALWTIVTNAAGMLVTCVKRTIRQIATYIIAMNGTTFSATAEILWIPPMITRATKNVRISPEMTTLSE